MRIGDALSCFAQVCYKPLGDKGEDAYAYDFQRPDVHAQAVFDGCGGAGAWKYPEFKDASGAFVAAQSVARAFLAWSKDIDTSAFDNPARVAGDFHQMASELLIALKESCAPMGVSGSLVKSFPCTASVALMTLSNASAIELMALNAGDSRVYYLTPQLGLIQLTHDDSRGNPDPLQSLRDSAPLSNLLNADKPFNVSARSVSLHMPCAIVCATDGAFGFLRSPMDFEYILLRSLCQANTMQEFEQSFGKEVERVTGDDSTLIMSFYGWKSYADIRKDLSKRLRYVEGLAKQMDAAGDDLSAMEAVAAKQWEAYKVATLFDEMKV